MRKVLVIILVFLSIILLVLRFGSKPLMEALGIKERAGIRIEANQKAKVLINDVEVGETPFQNEDLEVGEYHIALKSEATESATLWTGFVELNTGTLTVVNRDLAKEISDSSGEVITLERGVGVVIVSNPPGAQVLIDGKDEGLTPLYMANLSSGEHQFILNKTNFLKRSIRATAVADFKLSLVVDLAITEADLTKLQTTPLQSTQMVTIKKTPTGFLRVRETASANGKEVGQLKPGESVVLLEELNNWYRIRLADNKEGYIASQYAEKKSSQ